MIEVRNLYKKFDGADFVLKDISFKVGAGEFVVILGRSGAGKSTLLRCLNRLTVPTSGTLYLDGELFDSRSQKNLRRLRQRVAMVFQGFNLSGRLSVLKNVLVGRMSRVPLIPSLLQFFPPHDVEIALRALAAVGLESKAQERADSLSGGQQQRVGIARALAQQPELILADEPIASLDPQTARRILCCLRDASMKEGISVVCSLHQLEFALEFSTRIIGLADGEVVFDGAPEKATSEVIKRIYPGIDVENIAPPVRSEREADTASFTNIACAG